MGIIRFALALIVLASHVGFTDPTIGSFASVQAFFVLSGFYMAAVYSTKYSKLKNGAQVFFINRVLRLWPTYLFLLGITYFVFLFFGGKIPNTRGLFNLFEAFHQNGFAGVQTLFLALSFVLFGQDFFSVSENFHYLLPVRQSWSIASELLFYSSVPWLLKIRDWRIYVLVFLGLLGFKAFLFDQFGWRFSYFIPIGNWGYFILGCGLYFLMQNPNCLRLKASLSRFRSTILIAALALIFCFGESCFERSSFVHHLIFISLFSLAALLLFEKSVSPSDSFLGNLSYGLYLNHYLIYVCLDSLGFKDYSLLIATSLLSVLFSFLTDRFVQQPFDRYRHRLAEKT